MLKTSQNLLVVLFSMLILMSCESDALSELAEDIDDNTPPLELVTYDNRVATILNSACIECHNSVQATAGIQLQNFEFARDEAESGRMIIRMTNTSNPMPPSGNLPGPVIADIMQWIEDGLLEN